jgi:spore germination protein
MGRIIEFLVRTDVWLGAIVVVLVPVLSALLFQKLKELRRKTNVRPKQHFIPANIVLTEKLTSNVKSIKAIVGDSSDIIFRQFNYNRSCSIVHVDGLVDAQQLQQD